jgi:O-succinylbenzoate synthase
LKIIDLKIYRYEVPLVRSLRIGGRVVCARGGVVVEVVDERGVRGFGEGAPLGDELDRVIEGLCGFRDAAGSFELPDSFAEMITSDIFSRGLRFELLPSARFAVESALFDVLRQRDLAFGAVKDMVLPVNGLLMGQDVGVVGCARELAGAGFRAIKVKVGRQDIGLDIERVRQIREAVGGDVMLRLDANRGWSVEQAVEFAEAVGSSQIEYIEEPAGSIAGCEGFWRATGCPVALDESLVEIDEIPDWPAAIVLKPSVLGGFFRTAEFMRIAKAKNIKAVISSAFESSVGLKSLAIFAAMMGLTDTAVGLDTLKWFGKDVAADSLEIENGEIGIGKLLAGEQVLNRELLEEVNA